MRGGGAAIVKTIETAVVQWNREEREKVQSYTRKQRKECSSM